MRKLQHKELGLQIYVGLDTIYGPVLQGCILYIVYCRCIKYG